MADQIGKAGRALPPFKVRHTIHLHHSHTQRKHGARAMRIRQGAEVFRAEDSYGRLVTAMRREPRTIGNMLLLKHLNEMTFLPASMQTAGLDPCAEAPSANFVHVVVGNTAVAESRYAANMRWWVALELLQIQPPLRLAFFSASTTSTITPSSLTLLLHAD